MGRARGGAEPGSNRPQSHWDPRWNRARLGQSRAGAPRAESGERDRLGTKPRAGPPTPPGLSGLLGRASGGAQRAGWAFLSTCVARNCRVPRGQRVRAGRTVAGGVSQVGREPGAGGRRGHSPGPREGTVPVVVPLPQPSGRYGALPSGETPVSGSSAGTDPAGRTWSTQVVAVSE